MSNQEPGANFYHIVIIVLVVAVGALSVKLISLSRQNDQGNISASSHKTTGSNQGPGSTTGTDQQASGTTTSETNTSTSYNSDKTTCQDVTSYDYNWENDVLCTRPDGSTFYTDYAGGYSNDPNFQRSY